MSLDNLPVEWLNVKISDVTVKGEQRKPNDSEEFIYVDIGSINRDLKKIESPQFLLGKDAPSRARKVIKSGDILVSLTRPNLNAVALVGENYDQQIASTGFEVISAMFVESKYLFSLVRTQNFINEISKQEQGALYPAAKSSDVQAYEFPLPPLAEQQEIVRQLDVMLAQVEQIKARLDAIPAILKKFRQSVLESYFNNLASVQQVNLDDLVVSIDQGWSPKCLNTPASAEQWGVIKTSAIQPLYFDASENKELPSNLKPREALSLISGDVLITRAGPRARCGVTCIVDKDYDNLMICDKVYRVRCDSKKISADYLNLYLNSLTGLSLIEKMKTGSSESGMNLTQSKFKELVIPLVSLKQQLAFAKDIKKFFQLANHIEETVQSAQKRVNLLTQSILAKAFSGELTAEWREQHQELITGINSAESLLAKIQAEREASKPAKKTRKKKEV